MELKVKKLDADAILPHYTTEGAACFDLHALHGGHILGDDSMIFRTGLSFEVPEGYALMIYSRSGHGFKNSARLANCVGVIDSDYRGEVMVKLTTDSIFKNLDVNQGDRIAQAMLVPVPRVQLVEVAELSETERGAGGFGSTGK